MRAAGGEIGLAKSAIRLRHTFTNARDHNIKFVKWVGVAAVALSFTGMAQAVTTVGPWYFNGRTFCKNVYLYETLASTSPVATLVGCMW